MNNPVDKLFDRLVETDSGCWEFIGGRIPDGYGMLKVDGEQRRAHRVAYELWCGPIPEGLNVLHKCDNRACCNPVHLFLGTQQDNIADMVAKGRQRFGVNPALGVLNGRSRLSEDEVRSIRQYLDLGLSERQVANKFYVSRGAIRNIKLGLSWSWLS